MKSCANRNLDEKIKIVINDMQDWFATETFTDTGFSIFPILWQDGTDKVECRHGEYDNMSNTATLYSSIWYNDVVTREITNGESTIKFVKNEITGIYEP